MQQGVELIRGSQSLFQGILLMVVKDIQKSDAAGVADEFASKLNAFINKGNNGNSFVLQMVRKFVFHSFYVLIVVLTSDWHHIYA